MVAASTWPGRAAEASNNKARLSGPPDTATPMRACDAAMASRSPRKRPRIAASNGPPMDFGACLRAVRAHLHHGCGSNLKMAQRRSIALRLRLAVADLLANI